MAQVDDFYLPDDLYYDRKDHLWARLEDGKVRVGLDYFGQKAAGSVAYIKLMPEGKNVAKGRAFGSLEAGKYIGPLKAPVGGKLVEVNAEVLARPSLVNTDPYGQGWFVVIDPSGIEADLSDLAHGPDVQPWLEAEVQDYRAKGLLKD
ncbi:MAG: glycine cleavage system protein H [Chloroflexi bacterium]|nr:glycine cleavage system protein H [Chloroflexota bacterium]